MSRSSLSFSPASKLFTVSFSCWKFTTHVSIAFLQHELCLTQQHGTEKKLTRNKYITCLPYLPWRTACILAKFLCYYYCSIFHSIILIFHLHLCLATVEVRTRIVQTGHQSWVTVRMPAMAETLPCSPWARDLHTSSSSLTWRHQCTARSTETSVPAPCHPRQVKMPCSTISCEPSKMSELWVWKCGSGLTDEKFDQQAASSSSQPFYTFLPVGPVRRERDPSECKTDVSEGSVDLELKLWQGWMINTHTPCCCSLMNNGTRSLVNNGQLWEKNVETCV
jgi:hypothetical protein